MFPRIEHPTYELKIPSTKKKIKVRPMLVKEEKILLFAKQSGERSEILNAVKQVVANCITDANFDVDKLTIFDLEYLFLKLRALSVNNVVKITYLDNEDEKMYDFSIDLNDIEVIFPEKTDSKIKVDDEITIVLKYPTCEHYSNMNDMTYDEIVIETFEKIFDKDKAIEIDESNKKELKEFFDELPITCSNSIRDFLSSAPKLFHEIKYKNSLGNDRTIALSKLEDFFDLR